MERGSLKAGFADRTNPLDKHMEVMAQTRGIQKVIEKIVYYFTLFNFFSIFF